MTPAYERKPPDCASNQARLSAATHMRSIAATGIASEAVMGEFADHAREEREHMNTVATRINRLGGKPNFNPEGLPRILPLGMPRAETLFI